MKSPQPQLSSEGKVRTLKVDYLARVEGEGALYVRIDGDRVEDVQLRIFEPPRFFEGFLQGRSGLEAPDITARICGICPVAYQMSACHAIEAALGVQVEGPLRALRRLLYCGEWIESHTLHIYLLHAPDFLGLEGAVDLARAQPALVQQGLALKKAGNAIVATIGGREIHPVNVRVGGFYRVPTRRELAPLREQLLHARDLAHETVRMASRLEFPALETSYVWVAMQHPDEYPMNEGRLVSSTGLSFAAHEFEAYVTEHHVEYTNALQSELEGGTCYMVGPMARYALNRDRLGERARAAADEAGLGAVCANPFQSILVRAVEVLHACDEAIEIIEAYTPPDAPAVVVEPRAGRGSAFTEAPRGTLYHRYLLDERGHIEHAVIVPPTSQNQRQIEADLRVLIQQNLGLPDLELAHRCEQAIRNYDPCISCATHFLRLEVERT